MDLCDLVYGFVFDFDYSFGDVFNEVLFLICGEYVFDDIDCNEWYFFFFCCGVVCLFVVNFI